MRVEGIGPKTAEGIVASRDKYDSCAELELADKLGVWLLHLQDERYPAALKQIHDPPPVLYIKGELTRADNLGVAIVGSRHCSSTARNKRRGLRISLRHRDLRSYQAWRVASIRPHTKVRWQPAEELSRCRAAVWPTSSRPKTPSYST